MFDITNDFLIAGVDSSIGNPTAEQIEKMERTAVGALTAFGGGLIASEIATGLLVGTAVGGPVGAAVGVTVAGVVGIASSIWGDDIYNGYKWLQRHVFDIIYNSFDPIPCDITETGLSDMIAPWIDLFHDAENRPINVSPLILDLDRDGVETTSLTSGAYFDHDGNGFAERTGWASSDDGLLVMDRDGDGYSSAIGNEALRFIKEQTGEFWDKGEHKGMNI